MSEPAITVMGRVPGALLLDGKYRLEAPIAVGGMGSVWRAMHTTLDRPVAVKFVDVDGASATVAERFLREAKVAAAIRHPNVIDILDFGRAPEGEAFMVMELLEGLSLDERLGEEPPLATIQVVQIAGQVLAGLEAVHRAGILHRDLKPGNVFLSGGDGEIFARLLDFGISYSLDPDSALRRGRFGTEDRLVVGTPEFMAPEQAEGRPDVDARADVYSVAVILYEALAGTLPYVAEHPGQVLYKVIKGECVPLGHLRPDIPEIAMVIEAAMHRDRDQRPPTARDFRRLLLSAAGVSGDPTGRFHVARSSGVDFKVSRPISDPPGMMTARSSYPPALRDAPTASLGLAPEVPAPVASVPPPPSTGRTLALVSLGVVLTLAGLAAAWALGVGRAAPAAVAADAVAAPSAPAEAAPPAAVAPTAVDPPSPPPAPAVAAPALVEETPPEAPVAAPAPRRSVRPAPVTEPAPGEAAAPPAAPRGGVVRELDF